jgi:hypothetical protein
LAVVGTALLVVSAVTVKLLQSGYKIRS